MSGRRFLQWSLALPVVAPALFLPFGDNIVGTLLYIAIGTGIWGYVPFALLMLWLLHRTHTYGGARLLMLAAPVVFVAVFAVVWTVFFFIQRAFNPATTGLEFLIDLCTYGLVIGYGYVLVVGFALVTSHTFGWVRGYELQAP
jgi:hypothetical protein